MAAESPTRIASMPATSAKRALGASYAVTIVIRWCCCFSAVRSEEHTSELQSPCNLVCRLLLEKKKLSPAAPDGRDCSHPNRASPERNSPRQPCLHTAVRRQRLSRTRISFSRLCPSVHGRQARD